MHNRRARGLEYLNVADETHEMHKAARWCVSAGLASRVVSLRNGAVASLEFYDACTHGVRLCFWDAYAQAVRPDCARTLNPLPLLTPVSLAHLARSSAALDAAHW